MNVAEIHALFGSAMYDPRIAAIMDRVFRSLVGDLVGVDIDAEYVLILQKKSRLSARLRRSVVAIKEERDRARVVRAD